MKLAILAAVSLLAFADCQKQPSVPDGAVEAGIVVVESSCRFIEAVTDDGTVKNICATIEEIADMVNFIKGLRKASDAGRASSAKCQKLEDICAAPDEVQMGIDRVLSNRKARLKK